MYETESRSRFWTNKNQQNMMSDSGHFQNHKIVIENKILLVEKNGRLRATRMEF